MTDIEELLARSRELLASSKPTKKPKREYSDVFLFRNQHWYPPKGTRDFQRINIYYPTVIPDIDTSLSIVTVHKHEPFEACFKKYFCHELGYEPSQLDRDNFMRIWGYLYDKPLQVPDSPFDFKF